MSGTLPTRTQIEGQAKEVTSQPHKSECQPAESDNRLPNRHESADHRLVGLLGIPGERQFSAVGESHVGSGGGGVECIDPFFSLIFRNQRLAISGKLSMPVVY